MASLVVAFLALFVVGVTFAESPMRLGGFGAPRTVNAAIQKAVDAVASQIRTNGNLSSDSRLTAKKYISQAVSGINYVVEILAENGRNTKVVHAKISADLRGKSFILTGVKDATSGDRLRSF